MPRDGSSVFTPPVGTLATPGTTIESAKYNAFVNDMTTIANEARPIAVGGTGATTATEALNNLGVTATATNLNATQYLSNRNLVLNGSGRVNQRGYVTGTATTGANEYTLDRWRVVTSGQSLTFTGTDARRTMTAPAGGAEQVIEGANIINGTYTISFNGSATCTVDGVAKASGDTVILTTNTDVVVRFSGGTFADVQLEPGDVATPFERLRIGQELSDCLRYYRTFTYRARFNAINSNSNDVRGVEFSSPMRVAPTITANITGSTNLASATFTATDDRSFEADANPSGAGITNVVAVLAFDSEIYD